MKTKAKIYPGRKSAVNAARREFERKAKLFVEERTDKFFIRVGLTAKPKTIWMAGRPKGGRK